MSLSKPVCDDELVFLARSVTKAAKNFLNNARTIQTTVQQRRSNTSTPRGNPQDDMDCSPRHVESSPSSLPRVETPSDAMFPAPFSVFPWVARDFLFSVSGQVDEGSPRRSSSCQDELEDSPKLFSSPPSPSSSSKCLSPCAMKPWNFALGSDRTTAAWQYALQTLMLNATLVKAATVGSFNCVQWRDVHGGTEI